MARKRKRIPEYIKSFMGGVITFVSPTKTADDGFKDLLNLTPYTRDGELNLRRGPELYWDEGSYFGGTDQMVKQFEEFCLETPDGPWYFMAGIETDYEDATQGVVWYRSSDSTNGYDGPRANATSQLYNAEFTCDDGTENYYQNAIVTPHNIRFAGTYRDPAVSHNYKHNVAIFGISVWDGWRSVTAVNQKYAAGLYSFMEPVKFYDSAAPPAYAEVYTDNSDGDILRFDDDAGDGASDWWIGVTFVGVDGQETPINCVELITSQDYKDVAVKLKINTSKVREWAREIRIYGAVALASDNKRLPLHGYADSNDNSILGEMRELFRARFDDSDKLSGATPISTGWISLKGENNVYDGDGEADVTPENVNGLGDYYHIRRGALYTGYKSIMTGGEYNPAHCLYESGIHFNNRIWVIGGLWLNAKVSENEWRPYGQNVVNFSHIHHDFVPYYDYFPTTNQLVIGSGKDGPLKAQAHFQNDHIGFCQNAVYRTYMNTGIVRDWTTRKIFNQGVDCVTAVCTTDDGVYFANKQGCFFYGSGMEEPQPISGKIQDTWNELYDLSEVMAGDDKIHVTYNKAKREVWFTYIDADTTDSITWIYNERFQGWYSIDRTPEWPRTSVFGGVLSVDSTIGPGVWHEDKSLNDHTCDEELDNTFTTGLSVSSDTLTVAAGAFTEADHLWSLVKITQGGTSSYMVIEVTSTTELKMHKTITETTPTGASVYLRTQEITDVEIPLSMIRTLYYGMSSLMKRIRKIWYTMSCQETKETGDKLPVDVTLDSTSGTKSRETMKQIPDIRTSESADYMRTHGDYEYFDLTIESLGTIFNESGGRGGGGVPDAADDADGGSPPAPSVGTTNGNRGFVLKDIGVEVGVRGEVR